MQIIFSPFRLPRTLQISLAGCDGEADAFYEDDAITICYELVDDWWKNMSKEATPVFSITPSDTVFGPFYEVSLHEFGHAFAVRRFGGEVHTMGIMFLIFSPLPYMDASAAWGFRNKWQRVFVGAAGMIFEVFVAACAIFVWRSTTV